MTVVKGTAFARHQSVVAFVDIVAFRDWVTRMSSDREGERTHAFNLLLEALTRVMPARKEQENPLHLFEDDPSVEVTAFSDCTVLSMRAAPTAAGAAWRVAAATCGLAADLLKLGLFCRGGIASGELVHERGVVLGEGMVKAHVLESKSAIYPRIIIEDQLAQAMEDQFAIPEELTAPIEEDADGLWYLDVYRRFAHEATSEELDHVEKAIREGIANKDLEYVAKWRWAKKKLENAKQHVIRHLHAPT